MAKKRLQLPPEGHRYQLGDRVKFLFGISEVEGVIVEDRGRIGVGGRRLYRIEFTMEPAEPFVIELPAVEFTAA